MIILDDSDRDDPLCIRTLYPIRYIRVPRCTIGMKRNMLVTLCQTKYVAFMDTDDMYHPDYISHSIFGVSSLLLLFHIYIAVIHFFKGNSFLNE